MDTDNFNFCLPFDVVKSETSPTEEWRIGGYASTPNEDRQGDEIAQKGLDINNFVNYGWFNFDHKPEIILGYPDKSKCRVDKKGFYVEGTLLKGISQSKNIWETAIALQKSGSERRLGFSVEGKVLKRNALGKIVKAEIYNVAITPNPVNTDCTWDALVKSFASLEEVTKSLEAGHGDTNGSPLIPESLESAFKTLSYAIGDDEESKLHMDTLKARLLHRQQNITKSEAILYLQLVKGLSFNKALQIISESKMKEEQ